MGTDDILLELLEGNETHVEGLPTGYFTEVQTEQHPDLVTICCSDSRVPQDGMWQVDRPGSVFTPSNIGNQAWDEDNGERIVDGSLLYPIHYTGTRAVAVVGHTGCGAVTAAYEVATGEEPPGPRGVTKCIELLVPVIEEGLESDLIDSDTPAATDWMIINKLVEYNVDQQASFLRESDDIPEDVSVYGFVYDFHGVYGDDPGRAYLVNLEGETRPELIAEQLPEKYADVTRSLLY